MMLKVEAYSATSKEPCQPPLHVCLATTTTTASSKSGIFLTVGRKEGLVLFADDKSVSRQNHMSLRFVSSTQHQESDILLPCPDAGTPQEQTNGDGAADPFHHLSVVLESNGKLGTILVHEPIEQECKDKEDKKKTTNNDDDSATVDSAETTDHDDDEGRGNLILASQAAAGMTASSQGAAVLSLIGREILGPVASKKARLEWLGPNQCRCLTQLSRLKGRVIVQCGKFGSTLVISRMETITFVKTSKVSIPARIKKKLDWIGAHEETTWDMNNMKDITTLISSQRDPSPKNLSAWSLGLPTVTPDYLEALIDRTDPAAPLPNPKDYATPFDNRYPFWHTIQPDPTLLEGTTYVSTKEEEMEVLVASAGAKVWKLYESESPEHDLGLLSKSCCFGQENRRKLTAILKKHGIPLVSTKAIAKAISEQDVNNLDTTIAEIVASFKQKKRSAAQSSPASSVLEGASHCRETSNARDNGKRDDEGEEEEEQYRKMPPLRKVSQKQTSQSLRNNNPNEESGTALAGSRTSKKASQQETSRLEKGSAGNSITQRGSFASEKSRTEDSDAEPMNTKDSPDRQGNGGSRDDSPDIETRNNKNPKAPQTSQRWLSSSRGGSFQEAAHSNCQPENKEDTSSAASTGQPQTNNKRKETADGEGAQKKVKRSRLGKGDANGWLEVAPKNDKLRAALVRTDAEIRAQAGYEVVLPRAKTERVAGMVLGPVSRLSAPRRNLASGVVDFRAFRKNLVAQASTTGETNQIRLRVHRPKESITQNFEYEEQRSALEEQQRRADALFRDPGARAATSRRRW